MKIYFNLFYRKAA